MKKQNKKHQNARFIDEKMKTKSLMFFVSFLHVVCMTLIQGRQWWVGRGVLSINWQKGLLCAKKTNEEETGIST